MKNLIRQGDCLFIPIQETDLREYQRERMKRDETGTIMLGESTGHAHRVAELAEAEVLKIDGFRESEIYVRVGPNGVSIIHEEHKTVQLQPNTFYKLHVAKEYDYLSNLSRPVRD